MPLMQLTTTGSRAFGVSLPKDDLRQLGLLDDDDAKQSSTMRVEEIVPGVWLVAPTESVEQQQYNAMKYAAYEASATPAPA